VTIVELGAPSSLPPPPSPPLLRGSSLSLPQEHDVEAFAESSLNPPIRLSAAPRWDRSRDRRRLTSFNNLTFPIKPSNLSSFCPSRSSTDLELNGLSFVLDKPLPPPFPLTVDKCEDPNAAGGKGDERPEVGREVDPEAY